MSTPHPDALFAVTLDVGSSLLNAAYFLPLLRLAWFEPAPTSWPRERSFGAKETSLMLLVPTVFTALTAVAVGLFASLPYSPLEWAQIIAQRQFAP